MESVKEPKFPQTAQELVEAEFPGDIDLSEKNLLGWRKKVPSGDANFLSEGGRKSCRLAAITFLVLYQGDPYFLGQDKKGVNDLVTFAKNVILDTNNELENELPSRGLEGFFTDSKAA